VRARGLADREGVGVSESLDAPRARGGGPPSQSTDTALQRETAVTIFQRGAPGRRAFQCPDLDVPDVPLDELLPANLRRAEPPRLPEVSEPEIVRHYVRLSKRNFDLDSGFYPLGSCTIRCRTPSARRERLS
jgi:glycine dehydrogenase subunit 2